MRFRDDIDEHWYNTGKNEAEAKRLEWHPIATVPAGQRVLVYRPFFSKDVPTVFEALAEPDGSYGDPVYSEWDGEGATHWMPLPDPPDPDS